MLSCQTLRLGVAQPTQQGAVLIEQEKQAQATSTSHPWDRRTPSCSVMGVYVRHNY